MSGQLLKLRELQEFQDNAQTCKLDYSSGDGVNIKSSMRRVDYVGYLEF